MLNHPIPIAITKPDWGLISQYTKEWLGSDITKGLTKDGIKNTDPAAFISSLKLDGEPGITLKELSSNPSLLQHSMITFLLLTDRATFKELMYRGTLHSCYQIAKDDDNFVCVLSGTFLQWQLNIRALCSDNVSSQLREIGNNLYSTICLNQTMKTMFFNGWKQVRLGDGSFVFV